MRSKRSCSAARAAAQAATTSAPRMTAHAARNRLVFSRAVMRRGRPRARCRSHASGATSLLQLRDPLLEALELFRVVLVVRVVLDRLLGERHGVTARAPQVADLGHRVEDHGALAARGRELDALARQDLGFFEIDLVLEAPPREV